MTTISDIRAIINAKDGTIEGDAVELSDDSIEMAIDNADTVAGGCRVLLRSGQRCRLAIGSGFGGPVGGVFMTLTEAQQKRLNDLAIGKIVTGQISIDDQIAAIRKQVGALSKAAKVPLDTDFQALDELVASEKAKKEKKVVKVSKKTIK